MIIGADEVEGDGDTLVDTNPADGSVIAEVRGASDAQVDAAVAAAKAALDGEWGRIDGFDRRRRLTAYAQKLLEAAGDIGMLASREMGAPAGVAVGEALAASEYIAHFAGYADKISGRTVTTPLASDFAYTTEVPVGVVAALPAWNAPASIASFKLGPALAAGCTVVLKSPELAPLATRAFATAAREAGLPDGVVNFVTGGPSVGARLVEHPDVAKVTFTGGTEIGRKVGVAAAESFKRVTLELGGKSANIVFEDADLDLAAAGSARAVFFLTGQQCVAGSRLFVQRNVFDDFVSRLAKAAETFQPGDPSSFETMAGPLVSEKALERVQGFVDDAVAAGGTVVIGGERCGGDLAAGYFWPPTIVTGVANSDPLCCDEVFGPVVAVIPFDTEDEVVALANDTRFGLAGGVWTQDLNKALRVAKRVHTGTMWVNTWLMITPGAPFGGIGHSGIGREGGEEAVREFTETKTVHIGGVY